MSVLKLMFGDVGDPDLALDFDFTSTFPSPLLERVSQRTDLLTFTRATQGTFFDSLGVLQTAATNVARFDHVFDGTTWNPVGLLMEGARTNSCLQSEDFTTTWVNINTDEPTTNNTAPDGNATADEIAATSTADQQFAIHQSFTGLNAGDATTVFCFIKVGTNATRAQLVWDADGGGTDGCFANFNLSAGTVGSVTAFAAGTATAATITNVDNGWFLCAVSGKIAAGTVGRITLGIIDRAAAAGFEAADLADNDSILAWGAQVEI